MAFGVGLDFGYAGDKRVSVPNLIVGTLGSVVTGGAVAAATWFAIRRLHLDLTSTERLLLAGGIGASCADTTRHAVRWVVERHGARGPLAERLNELAHADQLLPLIAVSVLFALMPTKHVALPLPLRDWPLLTIAVGLLLGGGAAMLVRSELRLEDTWGVLFGVTLITIGASARLSLSTLTASFFVGISVSLLSRHRRELRAMVAPTERPVLLPALVLAGAHLDFRASPGLPWLAAAAVAARLVAKILVGWGLSATSRSARQGGPLIGLSLMSCGALAISIGLAFSLRFPGRVGDVVLVVAAVTATFGEFVGPVRLRRTLQDAGEIDAPTNPAPPRLPA